MVMIGYTNKQTYILCLDICKGFQRIWLLPKNERGIGLRRKIFDGYCSVYKEKILDAILDSDRKKINLIPNKSFS